MGHKEKHCLQSGNHPWRNLSVSVAEEVEGSKKMPLRTELGNWKEAGKDSANLEETRRRAGWQSSHKDDKEN